MMVPLKELQEHAQAGAEAVFCAWEERKFPMTPRGIDEIIETAQCASGRTIFWRAEITGDQSITLTPFVDVWP